MNPQDTERDLRALLAEMLGEDRPAIGLDADLARELGLDSLARLRLLAAVEKRFRVRFPDERLGTLHTPRQLIEIINHQRIGDPT